MTVEAKRTRFPWGLTIVCALAFALLCGLGLWQVERMQWKAELIAAAEAEAARPAIGLRRPEDLVDFRKLEIYCPGIDTARYAELQSIHDGEAGVRLISVCTPYETNIVLLVDRGFVAGTISARPPVERSDRPITLIGEFRTVPRPGLFAPPPPGPGERFLIRDEAAIAEYLEAGPVAGTVFALTSSNPEWQALKPFAPPAAFSNNHLGYALTWFGLALALAGFYIALLRRKPSLKQPRSASEAQGKKEKS